MIDDNEAHYLKVLCDEIFGRINFISNVDWQKKATPQANAVGLSDDHDYILVYSRNKTLLKRACPITQGLLPYSYPVQLP